MKTGILLKLTVRASAMLTLVDHVSGLSYFFQNFSEFLITVTMLSSLLMNLVTFVSESLAGS